MLMQALVTMCAGASLVAALPSMIHQVMSPSARGLLMGMANSALAFFLFSYQASQWTRTNCLAVKPAQIDYIGAASCKIPAKLGSKCRAMDADEHSIGDCICHTEA
jgi:hypothetical protein